MSHIKALIDPSIIKSLTPEDTVEKAAIDMTAKHVGSVLITQNNRIIGIFTERDLLNKVIAKGLDPKKTPVSLVMTKKVVTVTPYTSIEDCYSLMKKVGCRHLPVIENNQAIGIISMRHVLSWTINQLEYERNQLEHYIQGV
jgi:signal-transduction protein with cAMP-binding, CBS, and nucleotidyltransferase domain